MTKIASTKTAATSPALAEQSLSESAVRLRLAIVRTARRLRQEAAGAGGELTPTSASALATVERHGPLTPSELAEIERVKRPTATRTLRVLTEAGLVDRAPDPTDGRSALVSITPTGRERLRRLRGRKNAYLARRMRGLSAGEVATLEQAAAILEGILEDPE
jgi:DNA-binding MarR family transcriptional regulator